MNNQNSKFDLIREQILKIVFNYLDKNKTTVYLFGSRAENKNGKYSDIDIGLLYEYGEIPAEKFVYILEDLNTKVDTLLKVDVVDFNRVDEEFKNFALKEAQIWHSPKNI
ncbi:MAG: nucleotidyltransferase domain-containing protein [Ignavibacteriae bacterium]|nr:nucleotidyltransferase domain-containing protein [Ignavibacteriota bacterium]